MANTKIWLRTWYWNPVQRAALVLAVVGLALIAFAGFGFWGVYVWTLNIALMLSVATLFGLEPYAKYHRVMRHIERYGDPDLRFLHKLMTWPCHKAGMRMALTDCYGRRRAEHLIACARARA